MTKKQYQLCSLKILHYRQVKAIKNPQLLIEIEASNKAYVAKTKRNPYYPEKDNRAMAEILAVGMGVKISEDEPKEKTNERIRARRRGFCHLTAKEQNAITIYLAMQDLGYGRDFEAWLCRVHPKTPNLDAQNYGKNPNYERMVAMFEHILSLGFVEEPERRSDRAKRGQGLQMLELRRFMRDRLIAEGEEVSRALGLSEDCSRLGSNIMELAHSQCV